MKIKLICIDIDGTLIGKNAAISEASKKALIKMRRAGYVIAFCSGRCMIDLRNFDPNGEYADYYIAFNGALIENRQGIIYAKPLEEEMIDYLFENGKKYSVKPTLCTSDEYYYGDNKVVQEQQFYNYLRKNNKNYDDFLKVKRIYVSDENDWKNIRFHLKDKVYKMEVACTDTKIECWMKKEAKIMKKKIEISLFDGKTYNVMPHFEITGLYVDKASGIRVLQQYLGIKQMEIAAIGDGNNDIPALKYAGVGIAMGNSSEYVKSMADYVTDSNLEEGVKKALDYIQKLI